METHERIDAMISLPFPARINPHYATVRELTRRWVADSGLADASRMQTIDAADFTGLAARGYPDASPRDLFLLDRFYVFYFIVDDLLDDGANETWPGQALASAQAMLGWMRMDGTAPRSPSGHLERAWRQCWESLREDMPATWQMDFLGHMAAYFRSVIGRLRQPQDGPTGNLTGYIEERRDNGGMETCFDCIELAHRTALPEPFRRSEENRRLRTAANDVACLINDLYSAEKEIAAGRHDNAVIVSQRLLKGSAEQAIVFVADLIAARARNYLAIKRTLPGSPVMAGCTAAESQAVGRYLSGLEAWMTGILAWTRASPRYRVREPA